MKAAAAVAALMLAACVAQAAGEIYFQEKFDGASRAQSPSCTGGRTHQTRSRAAEQSAPGRGRFHDDDDDGSAVTERPWQQRRCAGLGSSARTTRDKCARAQSWLALL